VNGEPLIAGSSNTDPSIIAHEVSHDVLGLNDHYTSSITCAHTIMASATQSRNLCYNNCYNNNENCRLHNHGEFPGGYPEPSTVNTSNWDSLASSGKSPYKVLRTPDTWMYRKNYFDISYEIYY
jgi:hypothetical protein